ncbi:MAG: hypothetical protein AAFQ94_25075 [Bacteroidota bacterium]
MSNPKKVSSKPESLDRDHKDLENFRSSVLDGSFFDSIDGSEKFRQNKYPIVTKQSMDSANKQVNQYLKYVEPGKISDDLQHLLSEGRITLEEILTEFLSFREKITSLTEELENEKKLRLEAEAKLEEFKEENLKEIDEAREYGELLGSIRESKGKREKEILSNGLRDIFGYELISPSKLRYSGISLSNGIDPNKRYILQPHSNAPQVILRANSASLNLEGAKEIELTPFLKRYGPVLDEISLYRSKFLLKGEKGVVGVLFHVDCDHDLFAFLKLAYGSNKYK